MRYAIALLTLVFGIGYATESDAYASYGNDLRYVSDTTIPGSDQPMALCHLVDYMNVLFVPVYTITESYALSDSACEGTSYRSLTPENVAQLQASGFIPADVPTEPTVPVMTLLWNHAWLVLGAFGILKTGVQALRGGRTRKAKAPDALAIHSLVAMSQVAVADGHIDQSETRQISAILTRLTGRAYSMEMVNDLLSRLNPSSSDLEQVGQDLSPKDRQIVLEAALNIAVADGEIHPNEYAVVSDLAQRMRISGDDFRNAMARISQHLQQPQAV